MQLKEGNGGEMLEKCQRGQATQDDWDTGQRQQEKEMGKKAVESQKA